MSDKSQCDAAMLIKACRLDADLRSKVLAGECGLLAKHVVENEQAWTEEELYGKGRESAPASHMPTPSELAEGKSPASVHSNTLEARQERLPSPSEIAHGEGAVEAANKQQHDNDRWRGR